MAITIQPFIWNELYPMNDEIDINDADEKCLEELKAVLEKHDRTSKFGIALLHKHFEMDESEVLVETADRDTRILETKPVTSDDAATMDLVPSIWRFGESPDADSDKSH